MRKSKFSQEQITYALKMADQGTAVSDICREIGISHNIFYFSNKRYVGLDVSEAKKL
jgi:putative transposase